MSESVNGLRMCNSRLMMIIHFVIGIIWLVKGGLRIRNIKRNNVMMHRLLVYRLIKFMVLRLLLILVMLFLVAIRVRVWVIINLIGTVLLVRKRLNIVLVIKSMVKLGMGLMINSMVDGLVMLFNGLINLPRWIVGIVVLILRSRRADSIVLSRFLIVLLISGTLSFFLMANMHIFFPVTGSLLKQLMLSFRLVRF